METIIGASLIGSITYNNITFGGKNSNTRAEQNLDLVYVRGNLCKVLT